MNFSLRKIAVAPVLETVLRGGLKVGVLLICGWPWGEVLGETGGTLRICTQNLARVGAPLRGKNWRGPLRQREALLERFREADCDVIAVQELFGAELSESEKIAETLANDLKVVTKRSYSIVIGPNAHDQIRNAFFLADDAVQLLEKRELFHENLPRLIPLSRPSQFTRAPIGAVLRVKGSNLKLFVVNLHFKSRAQGYKDPTGMDFEFLRMEMAEATRVWAESEERRLGEETVVVLLGDRNNTAGSATVEVLAGTRTLADFRRGGGCKVDRQLVPQCEKGGGGSAFIGLLDQASEEGHFLGSYRYRGELSILDDLLVESQDLKRFKDQGKIAAGVVGTFNEGSDHKLVYGDLSY